MGKWWQHVRKLAEGGRPDASREPARIFACRRRTFGNLEKMGKLYGKPMERLFSHFAKKLKMGKRDSKLLELLLVKTSPSVVASL
jgi:hypothetical protein